MTDATERGHASVNRVRKRRPTRRLMSKRAGSWWIAAYWGSNYGWRIVREPSTLFLDAGRFAAHVQWGWPRDD